MGNHAGNHLHDILKEGMSPADRISIIKNFIIGHRNLVGLEYRVYFKEDATETPVVEFKRMREDQAWSLKASLRAHNMQHIELNVLKMDPAERKVKRKNHNQSGGYNKF